jgi:hypothetical protein
VSRLDYNPTQQKATRDLPSARAARRGGYAKLGSGELCGAEHPSRKDGLGNKLKCSRPKGHRARKHKAKTKAGEVWWG